MLRGTEAHALADTGAADNFVSLLLVKHLDLEQNLRKKPYCGQHGLVEDADGLFSLSQLLSGRFWNAIIHPLHTTSSFEGIPPSHGCQCVCRVCYYFAAGLTR